MKYYPVSHGSEEWFECRRGIPTSSCFDKIITPTGKFSAQSEGYAHLLLAEIIMGESLDKFPPSYWMERGAIMEHEAAKLYEFETGYTLDRGGFITDDSGRWGCSPDRRILDKSGNVIGALEIKCPAPWTHVENLLKKKIDSKYIPQVQGQAFVGEYQFVDWFSYHPDMPPSLITTNRDEEYIAVMESGLKQFDKMMKEKAAQLVEIGALPEMPIKVMPEIKDGVQDLIDGETGEILMAG